MKQLFLLLFFVSGIVFAQKQQTDWEKFDLKGKVKSVKSLEYQAFEGVSGVEKGKVTRKYAIAVEKPDENSVFVFNRKGKLVEKVFLDQEKIHNRWEYQYNSRGKLIEERYYRILLNNEFLDYILVYQYNSKSNTEEVYKHQLNNSFSDTWRVKDTTIQMEKAIVYNQYGNVLRREEYDNQKTEEFQYDKNRNVIKSIEKIGNKIFIIESKYDEKNHLIQQTKTSQYGEDNIYLNYDYTYENDTQGNYTKRTNWKDGKISWYETYKYDSKGRKIEKNFYNPNAKERLSAPVIYKDDDRVFQEKEIRIEVQEEEMKKSPMDILRAENQGNTEANIQEVVEYDLNGNVILHKEFARGRLFSFTKISYLYDSKNNLDATYHLQKRKTLYNNPARYKISLI